MQPVVTAAFMSPRMIGCTGDALLIELGGGGSEETRSGEELLVHMAVVIRS